VSLRQVDSYRGEVRIQVVRAVVSSPLVRSLDRRKADLQDVFFNEPWFFIEGCLWALFGLTPLQPSSQRLWRRSAVVACVLAAAVGVLSGLGIIPTFRSG
jgi:hypothetical protein